MRVLENKVIEALNSKLKKCTNMIVQEEMDIEHTAAVTSKKENIRQIANIDKCLSFLSLIFL